MEARQLGLPDVLLLTPKVHCDARGFFFESYNRSVFAEFGIEAEFVQDNHSRSRANVLRGLHYQLQRPQGKLVRVIAGEILDVAVDVRRSSRTYRQWVAERLSSENHRMLWIPPGFAHGFLVLSPAADVVYKTTAYYYAAGDRSIRWDDPDIGIDWGFGGQPLLSDKDLRAPYSKDAEVFP